MRKKTFYIMERMPSLNDLIHETRRSRYSGAKMKKHYTELAAREIMEQMEGWKAERHVLAKVDFYESGKKRDEDNVISGLKYIMDGLVMAGVLKNDSPRYVHVIPEVHYDGDTDEGGKKYSYSVITLIELD